MLGLRLGPDQEQVTAAASDPIPAAGRGDRRAGRSTRLGSSFQVTMNELGDHVFHAEVMGPPPAPSASDPRTDADAIAIAHDFLARNGDLFGIDAVPSLHGGAFPNGGRIAWRVEGTFAADGTLGPRPARFGTAPVLVELDRIGRVIAAVASQGTLSPPLVICDGGKLALGDPRIIESILATELVYRTPSGPRSVGRPSRGDIGSIDEGVEQLSVTAGGERRYALVIRAMVENGELAILLDPDTAAVVEIRQNIIID